MYVVDCRDVCTKLYYGAPCRQKMRRHTDLDMHGLCVVQYKGFVRSFKLIQVERRVRA